MKLALWNLRFGSYILGSIKAATFSKCSEGLRKLSLGLETAPRRLRAAPRKLGAAPAGDAATQEA